MKYNIIIQKLILLSVFVFFAACSDDPGKDITIPDDGNIGKDVLAKICTDWEGDQSVVRSYMKGYTEITTDNEDILQFIPSNQSHIISYEFVDGFLRTSLLTYPQETVNDQNSIYSIENYKYIGQIDGASVYTNTDKNTMCARMEKLDGEGRTHTIIGFTPLASNLFDNFEPISVNMELPVNAQPKSATLEGEFSGTESVDAAYIYVSTTSDFASAKRYKAVINGSRFTANITITAVNATIYYFAEIQCGAAWYQSYLRSFEMPTVQLYSVGDPYPDATNPVGVVCAITNSGMNGTIISLDQKSLKWDVNGIFCTDYSAYNNNDGSKNKIGTSQPFGSWVAQHGSGWFGPARYQLRFTASDLTAINKGLKSLGYQPLNGFYWSSTQRDNNTAWVMTVTDSSYLGYSNQSSFYNSKNQERNARAMKYF